MHLLHLILERGSESTVYDTSLLRVFDCSNLECSSVNTITGLQHVLSAVLLNHPLMQSTKILFLILERANGKTVPGT